MILWANKWTNFVDRGSLDVLCDLHLGLMEFPYLFGNTSAKLSFFRCPSSIFLDGWLAKVGIIKSACMRQLYSRT